MQENQLDIRTSRVDNDNYIVEFLSGDSIEWAADNIKNGVWSKNGYRLYLESQYYDHLIYELEDQEFEIEEEEYYDETDD